ncbi:hypothetical protein CC77DRAFT_1073373 [Alternaria alternata]|uniref:Uncharacterized protein n=1 Tax=Alternaria alternata TaxID=5599 RepID=A0A177DGX1_ALTAL|nr:hypothetical protein CC77DRAFT_1073373 [Alternaria alternata]OAG18440.1 hypothetical protein CC77DRAFT_1073373 [Alternaria alternata]
MHGCVNGKKTVGYVVRLIVFWFVLDRRIRDQTSEVSARLNLLGSPQEPLFITTTPDLRFSRPNRCITAPVHCSSNANSVALIVMGAAVAGTVLSSTCPGRIPALHPPNSATIAVEILMQTELMYTGRSMWYCGFSISLHFCPLTGRKSDIHAFSYPAQL